MKVIIKNLFKKNMCYIYIVERQKQNIFLRRIKPMKNNTILNNENIQDTNTRTCTCAYPNCNHVLMPNEGHGFRTKYGQRYLCNNHTLNTKAPFRRDLVQFQNFWTPLSAKALYIALVTKVAVLTCTATHQTLHPLEAIIIPFLFRFVSI